MSNQDAMKAIDYMADMIDYHLNPLTTIQVKAFWKDWNEKKIAALQSVSGEPKEGKAEDEHYYKWQWENAERRIEKLQEQLAAALQGKEVFEPQTAKGYTCKLCGTNVPEGEFHDCALEEDPLKMGQIPADDTPMSRDEVISNLLERSSRYAKTINEQSARIAELESQQQKGIAQAWVSVEKEKPERLENLSCSDVVLCYELGRNYTYPASYDYKYRQWFMNAIQQPEEKVNPTHWRELPQPPIESVKDESKH